jgi:hypothetical protein
MMTSLNNINRNVQLRHVVIGVVTKKRWRAVSNYQSLMESAKTYTVHCLTQKECVLWH